MDGRTTAGPGGVPSARVVELAGRLVAAADNPAADPEVALEVEEALSTLLAACSSQQVQQRRCDPCDGHTHAIADLARLAVWERRGRLGAQREVEHLTAALGSRVVVEQAKGLLAGSGGIGVEESFARLRSFARSRRRSLHDVARALVARELTPDSVLDGSQAS